MGGDGLVRLKNSYKRLVAGRRGSKKSPKWLNINYLGLKFHFLDNKKPAVALRARAGEVELAGLTSKTTNN